MVPYQLPMPENGPPSAGCELDLRQRRLVLSLHRRLQVLGGGVISALASGYLAAIKPVPHALGLLGGDAVEPFIDVLRLGDAEVLGDVAAQG